MLLYVSSRDLLNISGKKIDRNRGLYIPLAIVNAVYEFDDAMLNIVPQMISKFRMKFFSASFRATNIFTEDSGFTEMNDVEYIGAMLTMQTKDFLIAKNTAESLLSLQTSTKFTYCNEKNFHAQMEFEFCLIYSKDKHKMFKIDGRLKFS